MSNRIRTLVVSLVVLAMALPAGAQGLYPGRGPNGESALGWLWSSLVNPIVAVFATGSTPTEVPPPTAGDPDSPKDTLVVQVSGDPDGPTGDFASTTVPPGEPDGGQ